MPQWIDLFLAMPLSEKWLHGLLFIAFGLHLLFVLLMLGTALLGLVFFLQKWVAHDVEPQKWNKHILYSHLGLKSLAVVLGVAPLLIIQVRYSHAFFTATGLFSYAWVAIIPLLIIAFLSIDGFVHHMLNNSWGAFIFGIVGVGALLTVPAIFTGVLSLMERQAIWPQFAARGLGLDAALATNWLLRYLHILGAACVFGAAFHLFFSTKKYPERVPHLRAWVFGAILAQVVIGIPLIFSVASGLDWPVLGTVTVGAATAMLTLWALRPVSIACVSEKPGSLLVLLPVILVSMLLTRQFLQDQALAPGHMQAEAARRERSDSLAPYHHQALKAFTVKLATVYDNGDTIYTGACQPCHGTAGHGDGPAASRLLIPAADLASIRADRGYIYGILKDGTPGSAMPYFRLYDREKLELVLDTLSKRFSMFAPTTTPTHKVSPEAIQIWHKTCSVCHAPNGSITPFGHTLLPPPPDLRYYSLTPERALDVIAKGYPGTGMQPYRALPDTIRRELAIISNSFRRIP